jgi:glycosyltransferase involved in cell wall biosynthesis
MRVAVISDLWVPFPGGAERLMFNVTRELRNRGHEVSVYCSYENAKEFDGILPYFKSTGVTKYNDCPGHTHADGWNDIRKWMESVSPQVILTHGFFANEFPEIFNCGIPVVQVLHNGKRNPKAALTIYNSQYTRKNGEPQPQDMVILPPAFDDCVASEHGNYIGFIKPIQHKGVEFIFSLAAHCSNREFMILHGEWTHIEIIKDLPNITYLTAVNDIRDFYSRCRVVLVPSLYEDAGTVPQESALNGLPCISSNIMGLVETNKGGIVLPHDKFAWAAEIDKLDNPTYYAEVAGRQKTYILELNWPGQFDELSRRIEGLK